MPGLFIIEKGAGGINWGGGQPPPLKFIEEAFHVIIQSARLDEAIEQWPQRESVLHVLEFGIDQLRWITQPFHDAPPVIRLVAEDANKTVFALVGFSNRRCLAVSGALRYFTRDTVARD